MTTPGHHDHATGSGAAPRAGAGSKPVTAIACPNCGSSNRITPSERGAPFCGSCGKPLPWLVNANEQTFEMEIKASPTVVVDLWAPWCGPCRVISPILEELTREYPGRIKVVKVNVDENPGLAARYNAMSIPTLVVIRDGDVVDRIVGALPKPALTQRLIPHLKPPKTPAA
jgi:thioredoxin 2